MNDDLPALVGLLFAGGRSSRMGADKAALRYAGEAQLERAYRFLEAASGDAWVCVAANQADDPLRGRFPCVVDEWADAGPMAALATALRRWPGRAFLVLACDLPVVSRDVLATLVAARDPRYDAVVYASPHDGEVEPLCAVYEPTVAAAVDAAMREGNRSLRALLAGLRVRCLPPPQGEALFNVNTPEQRARANELLRSRRSE